MVPLKLPASVISQSDIARLLREMNSLNDFFVGAKTRAAGSPVQLPKLSRMADQLAQENTANLVNEADRARLSKSLQAIHDSAPNLHISFAVEPSPRALEKILVWIRQNIHPQALLQVGLQPAIAGGCMLRTTNKVFDMSLRTHLTNQSAYLAQLINGAVDGS